MSAHRTTVLSRIARGLAAVSIVTLAVIGATGAADAATVEPVTDYGTYPEAIPSGCPDGAGALAGLSFSNGRGDTASSLGELDVQHGDTVTMNWTGFHEGCLDAEGNPAIMVGLAAYDTVVPGFNVEQDQQLVAWASCGAGADECDKAMVNLTSSDKPKSTYHLALTMPTSRPCNVQLDAILGRPLAVVGPNGGYYSAALRGSQGDNRLMSATHFTLEPCEEKTSTTTPTTAPNTTAAPTTTGVTVPAATVAGQSLTRNAAPAPVLASGSVSPTTLAQVAQQQLPATGRNSVEMLRLAAWLCLAGAAVLMMSSAVSRRFLR